jgi:hypothetical protein
MGAVVAVGVFLLLGLPFGLGQKETSPSPNFSLTSLEPESQDWFGIDLTYSSEGKANLLTQEPQTVGLSSVGEQSESDRNGSLVFSGGVGVERVAGLQGDLLEFTLSNSGSGVILVDRVWVEVLSWQPYAESSFPMELPPAGAGGGGAMLTTYEFDVNLKEGEREYVISEGPFKYAYGDVDLFRIRITSVDPGIVDFAVKVSYRELPIPSERGLLTSPARRVVFEERRAWQEFLNNATFTRALMLYPAYCYNDIESEGRPNLKSVLDLLNSGEGENVRLQYLYVNESCPWGHDLQAKEDYPRTLARRLGNSLFSDPQELMIFSDDTLMVRIYSEIAMVSHDKELIAQLIRLFDEAWEDAE